MKLYTHEGSRKNESKVAIIFALILIGCGSVLIAISSFYLIKNNGFEWHYAVGIIICILFLFWILDTACRFFGDKIEDGKIIYYKFFIKHTIDVSKIKVAVISACVRREYPGFWGTMRKDPKSKQSMPCVTILKEINEYKGHYFYAQDIKVSEREDFIYSFNAPDDVLKEFLDNTFQGQVYVSDRIYNENKELFEKFKSSLKEEQLTVYEPQEPINEIFY